MFPNNISKTYALACPREMLLCDACKQDGRVVDAIFFFIKGIISLELQPGFFSFIYRVSLMPACPFAPARHPGAETMLRRSGNP